VSSLPRILELAEITGRARDERFRALMRRLARSPDPGLEANLLRQLTAQAGDEAYAPQPFRAPTASDLAAPGIPALRLGSVVKLAATGVREIADFSFPLTAGHVGVFGATRRGKSMAVARLLAGLPAGARYLVIDPENDPSYEDLALSQPAERSRVIGWQDLKVGPFAPVSDPMTWRGAAIRNLSESFFLRYGSRSMLNHMLDYFEREEPGQPVSVARLYEKLMQLRFTLSRAGREYTFFESLKNRFEGLLANQIYDCAAGPPISDLTSRNTWLRLRGMPENDFVFTVNDVLLRLAQHFAPDPNPVPKLVVVLEETHRLTNKERLRQTDISEPVLLEAARTLAKCRVSLVFVDQVPSELPPQILANCSSRFVFSTIEGRDLDAIQRSMSLSHEQRAALSRLPRQVCVVQYANPSFPEPFCVRVADGPVGEVTAAALAARMGESASSLDFVPVEARTAPVDEKKRQATPLLSHAALNYLVEIAKDEFEPASWRDRRLGIPISQGNALRKELLAAGVISLETVNTYSRARKIKNTVLTEKGREQAQALKVSYERPRGIGSWEHVYHQHAIASWASRNGYSASVEHFMDGKSVDVSLEKGGVAVACEVLIEGVAKELNNLRDLQAGYSEIWYCVKSEDEARRLRGTIEARLGSEAASVLQKLRFHLLREFQPDFDAVAAGDPLETA
jgi:hypothetical protein